MTAVARLPRAYGVVPGLLLFLAAAPLAPPAPVSAPPSSTGTTTRTNSVALPGLEDFSDLAINGHRPSDHPEHGEEGDENPPGADPSIRIEPDEETEDDAAGHGQADLHENRRVLQPGAMFFVVEPHVARATPSGLIPTRVIRINRSDPDCQVRFFPQSYHPSSGFEWSKDFSRWLIMSNACGREIRFMFMSEKYQEWIKDEIIRLKEFFAAAFTPGKLAYSTVILQDGGELNDNVLADLEPEVWEDFQRNFIDKSV